jgi:CheY-specific phosphatase CheX
LNNLGPANPALTAMAVHLKEAARELFATYEIDVSPSGGVGYDAAYDDDRAGMAVIGYAGRGVRGALVMMATADAASEWMAAAGVPDGDVEDTLGEFSNMLLGGLKSRLLPLGISILATTPTVATGAGLRLSAPPGPSLWAAFDGPGWQMKVRLDVEFDPDFRPASSCSQLSVTDVFDLEETKPL